jgi:hypothetical protein
MSVAAEFADKSETVSYLPPTTLYALAAASTPAALKAEVVSRLVAGERPPAAEIQARITEARTAQRRRSAEISKSRRRGAARGESKDQREKREARQARQWERDSESRRIERERREAAADDAVSLIVTSLDRDAAARLASLLERASHYDFVDRLTKTMAKAGHQTTPDDHSAAAPAAREIMAWRKGFAKWWDSGSPEARIAFVELLLKKGEVEPGWADRVVQAQAQILNPQQDTQNLVRLFRTYIPAERMPRFIEVLRLAGAQNLSQELAA